MKLKKKFIFVLITIIGILVLLLLSTIMSSTGKENVIRSFKKNIKLLSDIVAFAELTEGYLKIYVTEEKSIVENVNENNEVIRKYDEEEIIELVKQIKKSTSFVRIEEYYDGIYFFSKTDEAIDIGVFHSNDIEKLSMPECTGYEKIQEDWYYFFFGYV